MAFMSARARDGLLDPVGDVMVESRRAPVGEVAREAAREAAREGAREPAREGRPSWATTTCLSPPSLMDKSANEPCEVDKSGRLLLLLEEASASSGGGEERVGDGRTRRPSGSTEVRYLLVPWRSFFSRMVPRIEALREREGCCCILPCEEAGDGEEEEGGSSMVRTIIE